MIESLKVFFTEAKSEFKKISWPGWEEIKGSTAVVCVTILFLMAVLALYDLGVLGVINLLHKVFK
jgi:preprotein translocase SecE subunit